MYLGLIPIHFVRFFKDGRPLPPSFTESSIHKSEEASLWEFKYLDQQARFRDLINIEKGDKPSLLTKSQTNPIQFCVTLMKSKGKISSYHIR
jgi:hypothetical protein